MSISLGIMHIFEQQISLSFSKRETPVQRKSEKTDSLELLLINSKTRTDLLANWQWTEDMASMRWHVR